MVSSGTNSCHGIIATRGITTLLLVPPFAQLCGVPHSSEASNHGTANGLTSKITFPIHGGSEPVTRAMRKSASFDQMLS